MPSDLATALDTFVEAQPRKIDQRRARTLSSAPRALTVADLHVSFGGVKALAGVSFAVSKGEICSIIGPNGAGKTTLLNAVSGVHPVERGRIQFFGLDLTHAGMPARARAGVGRTFQNLALFKRMSVLENVLVARHSHMGAGVLGCALFLGRARTEERFQRARAASILRRLGLDRFQDVAADTLPYGLQKRVELARALALDPQLLLLDEPMAGLTHDEKQELIALVRELNQSLDITVVLIEHDMGVVMKTSDRIVVLDQGVRLAEGPPAEIANDERVIRAYLGEA